MNWERMFGLACALLMLASYSVAAVIEHDDHFVIPVEIQNDKEKVSLNKTGLKKTRWTAVVSPIKVSKDDTQTSAANIDLQIDIRSSGQGVVLLPTALYEKYAGTHVVLIRAEIARSGGYVGTGSIILPKTKEELASSNGIVKVFRDREVELLVSVKDDKGQAIEGAVVLCEPIDPPQHYVLPKRISDSDGKITFTIRNSCAHRIQSVLKRNERGFFEPIIVEKVGSRTSDTIAEVSIDAPVVKGKVKWGDDLEKIHKRGEITYFNLDSNDLYKVQIDGDELYSYISLKPGRYVAQMYRSQEFNKLVLRKGNEFVVDENISKPLPLDIVVAKRESVNVSIAVLDKEAGSRIETGGVTFEDAETKAIKVYKIQSGQVELEAIDEGLYHTQFVANGYETHNTSMRITPNSPQIKIELKPLQAVSIRLPELKSKIRDLHFSVQKMGDVRPKHLRHVTLYNQPQVIKLSKGLYRVILQGHSTNGKGVLAKSVIHVADKPQTVELSMIEQTEISGIVSMPDELRLKYVFLIGEDEVGRYLVASAPSMDGTTFSCVIPKGISFTVAAHIKEVGGQSGIVDCGVFKNDGDGKILTSIKEVPKQFLELETLFISEGG